MDLEDKNQKKVINKNLFEIHSAVLLFGLAGLFGKLINAPSIIIVLGRTFFASIFLFSLLKFKKIKIRLNNKKDYIILFIMGIILTVHWVTFFKSIQLSTVALGLLTFSTFPIFVTFLEPLFFKSDIKKRDFGAAAITFMGVTLIIPGFEFKSNMTIGALLGIISGLTFAVLSILNKRYVSKYSSLLISFYENSVAAIVLVPFLFYLKPQLGARNVLLLIVLGVIFTGISHTLFIKSMTGIRAQTASIIASLEPVYGIIAAAVILGDIPSVKEIIGGVIILGAAYVSTIRN